MKNATIIKLDEEFTVQSDPYCWILKRETFGETNPKTGRPKRSVEVAYLPNLLTALSKYLDSTLKGSSEVLELFTRLTAAERNIADVLRNLNGKRVGRVDDAFKLNAAKRSIAGRPRLKVS